MPAEAVVGHTLPVVEALAELAVAVQAAPFQPAINLAMQVQ
jgi:hypothetical protein